MQITIVNQQGHNFGDEAAGLGLITRLLEIEELNKINILYASESTLPIVNSKIVHRDDITLRKVGIFNLIMYLLFGVKRNLLKDWVDLIKQSDYIFVSPCGASIGIYKDYRYILRLLVVVKARKKMIFHYNTINSSGSLLFDFISKYILKKSDVNVRELKSSQYLSSIGIPHTVGTDSAFLLSPLKTKRDNYLCFIPAHFDDWHPYFKKHNIDNYFMESFLPILTKVAKKNNLSIVVLPHFDLKTEHIYCEEIKDKIINFGIDKSKVIVPKIYNYQEYDKYISSSLITVGMRYHSCVLAAKNAIPFLTLSYENKMNEVATYTEMSKFVINLYELNKYDSVHIESIIDELINNNYYLSDKLSKRYVNYLLPNVQKKTKEVFKI